MSHVAQGSVPIRDHDGHIVHPDPIPAGTELRCQVCDTTLYITTSDIANRGIVHHYAVIAADGHVPQSGEVAHCPICKTHVAVYAALA